MKNFPTFYFEAFEHVQLAIKRRDVEIRRWNSSLGSDAMDGHDCISNAADFEVHWHRIALPLEIWEINKIKTDRLRQKEREREREREREHREREILLYQPTYIYSVEIDILGVRNNKLWIKSQPSGGKISTKKSNKKEKYIYKVSNVENIFNFKPKRKERGSTFS